MVLRTVYLLQAFMSYLLTLSLNLLEYIGDVFYVSHSHSICEHQIKCRIKSHYD